MFSGSHEARWPTDNNLYTLDLNTGKIINLSSVNYDDRSYDEHAKYTPDGTKIIWGTSRDNNNKGMDYWIMNEDGTNQKRLTYFNHPSLSNHVPKGGTYTACDFSFHPNGKQIVAWVFTDLKEQEGFTAIIEFK